MAVNLRDGSFWTLVELTPRRSAISWTRATISRPSAEPDICSSALQGKHSVVFDEAENRMHAIKAVLVATMG